MGSPWVKLTYIKAGMLPLPPSSLLPPYSLFPSHTPGLPTINNLLPHQSDYHNVSDYNLDS